MPNDKIQDAIKRANNAEANSSNYEECYYLISSSGGVFILVKTVTDNKNRSASDVRGVVGRYKMSIGESSAIDFLFENIGIIKYEKTENNFDAIFEKAIECGAKDVTEAEILEETDEEEIASPAVQIVCEFKDFNSVKTSLEETFGEAKIAETVWVAKNKIEINEERRITMQKVIDELEELDDVSTIYTNF
jgi:YebC/PmpR family DNA-binding regulatory protein